MILRRVADHPMAARLGPAGPLLLGGLFVAVYVYVYGVTKIGSSFVDAPSFWVAAETAFDLGEAPYGAAFVEAAAKLHDAYVHPFLYPPPSLLLLSPLSELTYSDAAALLLFANIASALLCAALFARALFAGWGERRVIVYGTLLSVVVFLGAQPTRITLGHGQVNLVVLLLATAFLLLLRDGRRATATLCLGLAVFLKLYIGWLVVALLMRGDWRGLAWFTGWLTLFSALSLIVLPDGAWVGWLEEVVLPSTSGERLGGRFDLASPLNHSLTGVFLRAQETAAAGLAQSLGVLRVAAVLATLGLTAWISRRRRRQPLSVPEFCAGLGAVFLCAPLSWTHYMVFLVPGVLSLLVEAARRRAPLEIGVGLVCAAVLMQNEVGRLGSLLGAAAVPTLVAVAIWALNVRHALAADPDGERTGSAARPLGL